MVVKKSTLTRERASSQYSQDISEACTMPYTLCLSAPSASTSNSRKQPKERTSTITPCKMVNNNQSKHDVHKLFTACNLLLLHLLFFYFCFLFSCVLALVPLITRLKMTMLVMPTRRYVGIVQLPVWCRRIGTEQRAETANVAEANSLYSDDTVCCCDVGGAVCVVGDSSYGAPTSKPV